MSILNRVDSANTANVNQVLRSNGSMQSPGDEAAPLISLSARSIRLEEATLSELTSALAQATSDFRAGEILILDVPGRTGRKAGMTRDEVGRALYVSGFKNSIVCAGRDVLLAEPHRTELLAHLLPSSALGGCDGPITIHRDTICPRRDRITCVTRRTTSVAPMRQPLVLSVIMPVYNEKSTFADVMDQLLRKQLNGIDIEICLVESNSTDGTRDDVLAFANHPRVKLLLEDAPCGKGHAVRAGLGMASGDIILIQDADLEYSLDDYEQLVRPVATGDASFVLGSRHHATGEDAWRIRHFDDATQISNLLNYGHLFFTWFLNAVFMQRLRDPFTMYKVFRRDCIYGLRFECNRFDFDHELVGKLIRNGYPPIEIDIDYKSRSFEEGKKVSFFGDPPTWIRACLQHRFSPLRDWSAIASDYKASDGELTLSR